MPLLRPCAEPRCGKLVSSGRCADHVRAGAAQRGTTKERGYGSDWERVRKLQLLRCPWCQIQTHCNGAMATEVDHIVPFKGIGDPLRLDPDNLQSACKPCNSAKAHARHF